MSAPVVINARAAQREQIGGVERVARELATRLPALRPDRYRVVRPPRRLAHRAGHAWEQAALPIAARGASLILSPANLAPVASRRNVVSIHDGAALRHPEWYSAAFVAYQRRLLPTIARRARRVITVSHFARAELASVLGVDPRRISVVPNGVDERFSADPDPEPARRALRLDGPYVVAVGSDIARKNLRALEPAVRRLADAGISVVAAGSGRAYMRGERLQGMRRLGYVDDALLPGLYAGARALAMPSLYEGFGLPCLEAMAAGTPVVAAARAALPETCGGAALLVDPDDTDAFAEALLTAATDERTRRRLIPRGRARAAGLTWAAAAAATDRVVEQVLEDD